jgi:Ca2+-binding RTX toxin-like protein
VIDWNTITVPNTLLIGVHRDHDLYAQTLTVTGSISSGGEKDYYKISGKAGDIVTIEVGSFALRRLSHPAGGTGLTPTGSADPASYIDSTLRLYDAGGTLVSYNDGNGAYNDDEFESTDSILLDVRLPSDGDYFIEVGAFLSDDTGNYELSAYRFATENRFDGKNTLKGRAGIDSFAGSALDNFQLRLSPSNALPTTVQEGVPYSGTVSFIDDGGHSWTAVIDYGDGLPNVTLTNVTPTTGIPLSRTYNDNGSRTISITLTNDDGQSVSQNFPVTVQNVAPTASIQISGSLLEGTNATVTMTGSDSPSDQGTLRYIITTDQAKRDAETYGSLQNTSSPSATIFLPDNPSVAVYMRVIDKDGEFTDYDRTINVANVAPTPVITGISSPRIKDQPVDFTAVATDPAEGLDTLSYGFKVFKGSTEVASRGFDSSTTFSFTPDSIGEFRVELTANDEDGGTATFSRTFSVAAASNLSVDISKENAFDGVANQSLGFVFEGSSNNSPNSYSFLVKWGDGTQSEFSTEGSSDRTTRYHTYANPGRYNLEVTVTDEYGFTASNNTFFRDVRSLEQQGNDWYFGGSSQSDAVELSATETARTFDVHWNRTKITASPITVPSSGRFVVLAGDGRDSVIVRGTASPDVFLVTGTGVTLNNIPIDLTSFEIQEIQGGSGNDQFTIQSLNPVRIVGGDGNDTIQGPNAAGNQVWEIQSAASGQNPSIGTFSSIERLVGGSSDDQFIFRVGASLTHLDGGAGINTLDYSRSQVSVNVDLVANTASQVSSLAGTSISMVIGSNQNDNLRGRSTQSTLLSGGFGDDTLRGGSAFDLLFGGAGLDTLYGEAGQDILIGARLSYETQTLGLMKVFEEWTRTDANYANRFNDRVRNLSDVSSSGKNGEFILKTSGTGRTILDDRTTDRLFGSADADWFFGPSAEVRDFNASEDRRTQ